MNFYIKNFPSKLSKQPYKMLGKSLHPLQILSPLTTFSSFRKDHYYFFAIFNK